jgi:hypothetical protein
MEGKVANTGRLHCIYIDLTSYYQNTSYSLGSTKHLSYKVPCLRVFLKEMLLSIYSYHQCNMFIKYLIIS